MATVRKIGLMPQTFGNGCILPITDFSFEFHPSYFLEGTLDMVMALYWRVREFTVTASVIRSGAPREETFKLRVGDDDGETDGFEKETDLICEQADWYIRASYGNTDFTTKLGPAYVDDDGNYFVSWGVDDGLETYRSNYRSDRDFGTNGTWVLKFSGYEITKPLYKVESNSGPASVVMNAVEYWPYDPNDGGGPIYDSTTGQQLRPFPP